jgi:DNA-binding response OmpR family regulator
VVDDDEGVRDWLSTNLRQRGFVVSVAATAREARALLLIERFDAAIVDVRLPDDDGLSVANEVSIGRGIPVVVISGYDEERVKARLERFPRERTVFLEKPFSAEALLGILGTLEGGS